MGMEIRTPQMAGRTYIARNCTGERDDYMLVMRRNEIIGITDFIGGDKIYVIPEIDLENGSRERGKVWWNGEQIGRSDDLTILYTGTKTLGIANKGCQNIKVILTDDEKLVEMTHKMVTTVKGSLEYITDKWAMVAPKSFNKSFTPAYMYYYGEGLESKDVSSFGNITVDQTRIFNRKTGEIETVSETEVPTPN